MKVILENKTFIITEIENDIFHWHFFSGELSLDDYMVGYNIAKERFNPNEKLMLMTTHDGNFHFSPDAWKFISNKNTDFSFMRCQAIVVEQLHLRILANFFIRLKRSNYETKVVSNKDRGLKWLKDYKRSASINKAV